MSTQQNKNNHTPKKKQTRKRQKKRSAVQNIPNMPASFAKPTRTLVPKGRSTGDGFRFRNTEFVQALHLLATSTFNPNYLRLRCNPGSQQTFHWLSSVATSFEFYKFHKLRFFFVTRSSTGGTGGLVFAPDYDAADAAYMSESEMCTAKGAVEGPMYRPLSLVLEPHLMNALYKKHVIMTDSRFQNTKQDQKTIDAAAVQIGHDVPGTANYGRLMVEYDVELMCPQPSTELVISGGGKVVGLSTNGQILANTALPIAAALSNKAVALDTTRNGTLPQVYPTDIIGTFVKDFQGILDITGNASYPNGSTPSPGVVIQNKTTAVPDFSFINSALNFALGRYNIDAKEGDILRLTNGNQPGLNTLTVALGGADYPDVL